MKSFKKNQSGFSAVEMLLVLAVVVILGAVGWYVWRSNNKTDNDSKKSSPTPTTTLPEKSPTPSAEKKVKYAEIKEWGVKISQPEGHTVAISKPSGEDYITGALSGVDVYVPKYDGNYTCGSSQGETYKAKVLHIGKFSLDSKIESNTKNKPDVMKTVGNYKYGISKPVSNCYDSATASTMQSLIENYLKDLTITSSN